MSHRLHHLALPVADVDASVSWYEAVFDATVSRRTDDDEADLAAGRTRQAWLVIGEGVVGEVLLNLAEGPPVHRDERQHFFHYALGVDDDLDAWLEHLARVAADVVGVYGHGGLSFVSVYVDDPDGYRWEIVVDYPSYDDARTAALAHGGVLGNPMASYEWTE